MKTNCPNCDGHIAYGKEHVGMTAPCPHCSKEFCIPDGRKLSARVKCIWTAAFALLCLVSIASWHFTIHRSKLHETAQLKAAEANRKLQEVAHEAEQNHQSLELKQQTSQKEEEAARIAVEKQKADDKAMREDWRIRTWSRQDRVNSGLTVEEEGNKFDKTVEQIATWFSDTGLQIMGDKSAEPWGAFDDNTAHYYELSWRRKSESTRFVNWLSPNLDVCYGPETKKIVQITLFCSLNITDPVKHAVDAPQIPLFHDAIRAAISLVAAEDVENAMKWMSGYAEDGTAFPESVKIGTFNHVDVATSQTISVWQAVVGNAATYKTIEWRVYIIPKGNRFMIPPPLGDWTGWSVPGSYTKVHGLKQFVQQSQISRFDVR